MEAKGTGGKVEQAVRAVHREDFLPADQRSHSHDDAPLPIGFAQTISQPSLVAEMTRELQVEPASRVLEIGTGSGYQTAILAQLAREVFTVERIPELAVVARERLDRLGYANISFRVGDGAFGWPEEAPFDRIMVTAAPPEIPVRLVEQLAPGGRMVTPVGPDACSQMLVLVTRQPDGTVTTTELFGVRFVPLVTRGR